MKYEGYEVLTAVVMNGIYCHVVSLKCQLTFNTLHCITSLKMVLFNYKADFRKIGCQDVKQMESVQQQCPTILEILTFCVLECLFAYLKNIYEYTYLIVYWLISHLAHFNNTHTN
jgi:hypothetical protein